MLDCSNERGRFVISLQHVHSELSLFKTQPLPVQSIASNIKHAIVAGAKVLQGRARCKFNQLPSEKCRRNSSYNSSLTFDGVSAIASAMRSKATSAGSNPSMRPSRIVVTSSSLNPYILPPAEFASIQTGHPIRTAVRRVSNIRCRCGTAAFCPSNHSASTLVQKTRGTRAAIFCGVRSRPSVLRTLLKTCRIRYEARLGSIPSTLAMMESSGTGQPRVGAVAPYN